MLELFVGSGPDQALSVIVINTNVNKDLPHVKETNGRSYVKVYFSSSNWFHDF